MLHKLNDSFVPLRNFNDHDNIIILFSFEKAPLDVLQTVFESQSKQRQQYEEILIYVSINLNDDSDLSLAAQKKSDFLKIVVA